LGFRLLNFDRPGSFVTSATLKFGEVPFEVFVRCGRPIILFEVSTSNDQNLWMSLGEAA
jgi:hypothetical protein